MGNAPFVANVLGDILAAKIPVYTVAIGAGSDQIQMRGLASITGGFYQFGTSNELLSIFNNITTKIYGEKVVKAVSGTVGEPTVPNVYVDTTMGAMTVSFSWKGNPLNLTLTQPNGNVIDSSTNNPNIKFTTGATYAFYTIRVPQPGQWTMNISGAVGDKYELFASTTDATILTVNADKDKYISGDPIKITASIEDSVSAAPTTPEYIHGATMQVTVEDPALTQFAFDLYDDGLHNDGAADDGIYANAFAETALGGSYNFNVHIAGNNNRDGSPFTREYPLTAVVDVTPPAVVSSVRANANPSNSASVNFTVKFSKPVAGVDVGDFTLTPSIGVLGATVSAVNASGAITALSIAGNDFPQTDVTATALTGLSDTYTVTVNTGAGNGTLRLNVINNGTITDAVLKPLSGATFLGGNLHH